MPILMFPIDAVSFKYGNKVPLDMLNVSVSKTEKDYQSNSRHRCAFKVSQTDLPCSM